MEFRNITLMLDYVVSEKERSILGSFFSKKLLTQTGFCISKPPKFLDFRAGIATNQTGFSQTVRANKWLALRQILDRFTHRTLESSDRFFSDSSH